MSVLMLSWRYARLEYTPSLDDLIRWVFIFYHTAKSLKEICRNSLGSSCAYRRIYSTKDFSTDSPGDVQKNCGTFTNSLQTIVFENCDRMFRDTKYVFRSQSEYNTGSSVHTEFRTGRHMIVRIIQHVRYTSVVSRYWHTARFKKTRIVHRIWVLEKWECPYVPSMVIKESCCRAFIFCLIVCSFEARNTPTSFRSRFSGSQLEKHSFNPIRTVFTNERSLF